MAKPGRKRLEFDLDLVHELGKIMCTVDEMAAVLRVSHSTIDDRLRNDPEFSTSYKKGLEEAKISLRRKQFELAMAGDVRMLIWLGKQYLGQSDRVAADVEHSGSPRIVVEYGGENPTG